MTIHSKPVSLTFAFLYQLAVKVYLKMTLRQKLSIRKLTNFHIFQWTKTLYQNILSHIIALLSTFLKGYRCN